MGCNFYYKNGEHIGKRSAWGLYCWECNTPHENLEDKTKCPNCGAERYLESLEDSAAGLELGFAKGPLKREGLRSTSKFSWAMPPELVKLLLESGGEGMAVEDEYGKEYTVKEFMEILEGCPVWSCDHIGEDFS